MGYWVVFSIAYGLLFHIILFDYGVVLTLPPDLSIFSVYGIIIFCVSDCSYDINNGMGFSLSRVF